MYKCMYSTAKLDEQKDLCQQLRWFHPSQSARVACVDHICFYTGLELFEDECTCGWSGIPCPVSNSDETGIISCTFTSSCTSNLRHLKCLHEIINCCALVMWCGVKCRWFRELYSSNRRDNLVDNIHVHVQYNIAYPDILVNWCTLWCHPPFLVATRGLFFIHKPQAFSKISVDWRQILDTCWGGRAWLCTMPHNI